MRIFGYLAISFLIVWLLAAPAPVAVAETATIQAVTPETQSPSQPTPEEDLLNLED